MKNDILNTAGAAAEGIDAEKRIGIQGVNQSHVIYPQLKMY